MTRGYWTCQRRSDGIPCRRVNPNIKRNCQACGKPRPARRKPAHMAALEATYDDFIALNGGEHCGICGTTRKPGGKRLHRDHDHRQGVARGLLCFPCNSALRPYMTAEWLRAALAYVSRSAPPDGVQAVRPLGPERKAA